MAQRLNTEAKRRPRPDQKLLAKKTEAPASRGAAATLTLGFFVLSLSGACNRPTGNIVPLTKAEVGAMFAPIETAKLEARLIALEKSVYGTALHNHLNAGEANEAVGLAAHREFAELDQAWELGSENISGRLTSLREALEKSHR